MATSKDPKKAYRYEDVSYASMEDSIGHSRSYVKVELREYDVIRVTPKGYWIREAFFAGTNRFVLSGAKKRFACLTKSEAMNSFVHRKLRQKSILTARIRDIEEALIEARRMTLSNK